MVMPADKVVSSPFRIMDLALTSDLDWASEYCIEHFLDIAERFSVTPTLFVTHASVAAFQAARDARAELGIHPNFLPGSSHGEDTISVERLT
jgi:hypothetical protein